MKKTWQQQGRDLTRCKVRERDGHRCTECKKKQPKNAKRSFHVHHLNGMCGKKSRGYDSVNDMHLLTTLCFKCHREKHDKTKYGRNILPKHREEVMKMREQGISYDKIGRKFGVSSQATWDFVHRPMRAVSKIARLPDSPLEWFLANRSAKLPSRS